LQKETKIVNHHTAESKPVKHEFDGTVILPPLVFPALTFSDGLLLEKYSTGMHYKTFYVCNGKESTINRALGGSTYPG
jgi:hypothetical protein